MAAEWEKAFLVELAMMADRLDREDPDADDFGDLIARHAEACSSEMIRSLGEHLAMQRSEVSAFEVRLLGRWGAGLDLYDLSVSHALETSRYLGDRIWMPEFGEHRSEALFRLYARALMISQEIGVLMRSGYGTAALARWRTIHELRIVFTILSENNDELSRRYLRHDQVELVRAEREWEQSLLEPSDINTQADAERRRLEGDLAVEFGEDFLKPYGWAAHLVSRKDRWQFRPLVDLADLRKWRPAYRRASHGTHANSTGLFDNVQELGPSSRIWTGPSNAGINVAGVNTLLDVSAMGATFVSCYLNVADPGIDNCYALVGQKVTLMLSERTIGKLNAIDEEMRGQEERISDLIDRMRPHLGADSPKSATELAEVIGEDVEEVEEALSAAVTRGLLRSHVGFVS